MSKMAFLVIDMQKGVCTSNAYQIDSAIEYIQRMIKACREKQIEVIFVRHDDGDGTLVSKGNETWKIIDQFNIETDDFIIDKTYNSAFKDTNLQVYLKEHLIDTLCISGMQTEHCVDATIKSAFERGYKVLIAKNSFTTVDQKHLSAKAINQFYEEHIWNHRYAQVVDIEKIITMM